MHPTHTQRPPHRPVRSVECHLPTRRVEPITRLGPPLIGNHLSSQLVMRQWRWW